MVGTGDVRQNVSYEKQQQTSQYVAKRIVFIKLCIQIWVKITTAKRMLRFFFILFLKHNCFFTNPYIPLGHVKISDDCPEHESKIKRVKDILHEFKHLRHRLNEYTETKF